MSILVKVRGKLKKIKLSKKFRRKNSHNFMNIRFRGGAQPDISKITVGSMSYGWINAYQFGNTDGKLSIGSFCSIADDTLFLLGGEHRHDLFTTYPCHSKIFKDKLDSETKGDIVIGNDVWIGNGVTILSGTTIGTGAVIAAGAVVTQDIEPYSICGGVPAKKIKYRFSNDVIQELMKINWNCINNDKLKSIKDIYDQPVNLENVKSIVKRLNA